MYSEPEERSGWRLPVAVVAIVMSVGVGASMFLGTQVSGILSTVGASVSTPGGGIVGTGAGAGQVGSGDSSGSDTDGSGVSDGSGDGGDGAALVVDVTRPDLLIIKTGEISLQAAAIGPAVDAATNAIVAMGGYASASERSGDGDDAYASVTFRIPSDRWEAALAAVRGAGEKVLDEHTATVDVTGEVVDLRARIRNLQTTEQAFTLIMGKATAIKDVLAVQAELTTVRGQIEQLSAKAADLEERAALSTLTVRVGLRPPPVIAHQEAQFDPGSEAEAATAQLVAILQALATAGIWLAIVWLPVLLALALVGGTSLLIFRRVRRGSGNGGSSISPAAEGTA
jgi:hypothetical protein